MGEGVSGQLTSLTTHPRLQTHHTHTNTYGPSGSPRARRGSAPVSCRVKSNTHIGSIMSSCALSPHTPPTQTPTRHPNPPSNPPFTPPRTLGEAMSRNSLKVTAAAASLSMFCSSARISDFFTCVGFVGVVSCVWGQSGSRRSITGHISFLHRTHLPTHPSNPTHKPHLSTNGPGSRARGRRP